MSVNLASAIYLCVVALVCIAVMAWLANRQWRGDAWLTNSPRRKRPWNIVAPGVLFGSLAISMGIPALQDRSVDRGKDGTSIVTGPDEESPHDFVTKIWGGTFLLICMTAAIFAGLASVYRAGRADLGLPEGWRDALGDARVGAIACAAALLPVMLINALLHLAFRPETGHPFIDQILSQPTPSVWWAVAVSAVIAAPWFEETAFRLLLQGWLESWECNVAAARERISPQSGIDDGEPADDVEAASQGDRLLSKPPDQADEFVPTNVLPHGLIPGIPYGWAPILISSILFGVAHWGHGVDPIALTFLGFVLGYVYQRTGRIISCVTAHALFNLHTMIFLALQS